MIGAVAKRLSGNRLHLQHGPIDLVIPGAGVYAPFDVTKMDLKDIHRTNAVNIDGVVNTVFPALDRMLDGAAPENGVRGQIAIMSSLAGFRGLPGAPAYSASKAAMRSWGEGLRGHLARHGVKVSVICPGCLNDTTRPASATTGRR